VLFQAAGRTTECSRWPAAAAEVVFERCPPLKPFPVRKGKRLAPGWWWSATTGQLVHYGSAAMRLHMMLLDRDPRVNGLAARPLELRWHELGKVRAHAPQLMLRLADGQGCWPTARPGRSCRSVSDPLRPWWERSVRQWAGGTGCSGRWTRSTGAMWPGSPGTDTRATTVDRYWPPRYRRVRRAGAAGGGRTRDRGSDAGASRAAPCLVGGAACGGPGCADA
jgi:hypothetical protein